MTDNAAATNGAAQPGPTLTVQKLYVKDASFEVPNAPLIFQEQGQPQITLNLSQRVNQFAEGLYEVVLTVTVTCKVGEKTAYLAEVHQAGVFGLAGFNANDLQAVLATWCPHTLYPYARQVVSDLILAGGFPPFLLQPINFEQVYADSLAQQRAQQAEAPQANA
jgi:preprotein translocase subunit SecB